MKEIIKGKFKSEFVRNVAVMFSGNGLALIFPLIMGPFISRLYSPEDFAGFELFIKIAAILTVVSSFRLEQAILLPKSQTEADSLFKLSFKILIGVSVVSLILIWPFNEQVGIILKNESISSLLWLLPLAVFFTGAYQIFTAYAIRLKKFRTVASNKILVAISNHGTKYMLGLSAPVSINLVWGQIVGVVLAVFAFFQIDQIRNSIKTLHRQEIKSKILLKKYRDFPVVNSAHAFFDEGQKALLLFIISAYHGAIVLGLFAFAWRYLKVPVQVFGNSLGQVVIERWARDINVGVNIRSSVLKMVVLLFAVSIIPFSILFFYGTPIFSFVFGPKWAMAGTYAEILAPWLLINFMASPISSLPVLLNKQRTSFMIALFGSTITLMLVFVMSSYEFSFLNIVVGIVVSNVLTTAVVLLWYIYISGRTKVENY